MSTDTRAARREAAKSLLLEGFSQQQVAEQMGLHETTVRRIRRSIPDAGPADARRSKQTVEAERLILEQLNEPLDQRLSLNEIAQKTGIVCVHPIAKRLGVDLPNKGRRPNCLKAERLIKAQRSCQLEERWPRLVIAEATGASYATVGLIADRLDVQLPHQNRCTVIKEAKRLIRRDKNDQALAQTLKVPVSTIERLREQHRQRSTRRTRPKPIAPPNVERTWRPALYRFGDGCLFVPTSKMWRFHNAATPMAILQRAGLIDEFQRVPRSWYGWQKKYGASHWLFSRMGTNGSRLQGGWLYHKLDAAQLETTEGVQLVPPSNRTRRRMPQRESEFFVESDMIRFRQESNCVRVGHAAGVTSKVGASFLKSHPGEPWLEPWLKCGYTASDDLCIVSAESASRCATAWNYTSIVDRGNLNLYRKWFDELFPWNNLDELFAWAFWLYAGGGDKPNKHAPDGWRITCDRRRCVKRGVEDDGQFFAPNSMLEFNERANTLWQDNHVARVRTHIAKQCTDLHFRVWFLDSILPPARAPQRSRSRKCVDDAIAGLLRQPNMILPGKGDQPATKSRRRSRSSRPRGGQAKTARDIALAREYSEGLNAGDWSSKAEFARGKGMKRSAMVAAIKRGEAALSSAN